jgi:hypothetical protein
VLVGPAGSAAPAPVLRFHLGRVFALLAAGHALAALLPVADLRRLVEALIGQHVEGEGDPELVQKISRALGWSVRRGLAAQARECAAAGKLDVPGWQAATALSANRGGLIACGSFAAARVALHAMTGVALPASGTSGTWEASKAVGPMSDLLQYAVSADYAAVRAQLL